MLLLLRRASIACIALAAALIVASPASADRDRSAGTLTIPGVGSSDILSWSWGITNPTTLGSPSGGAGSGKVQLQAFSLTKPINPLSTELTRTVALGSHFAEVVVSVPIGGPGSPFALEYTLRPVFVESLQQNGSADGATEAVKLVYGSFNQKIGPTSHFGWTKKKAKKKG